jgi:hypothetical protein
MIMDFFGQEGSKVGLVISMCSVHIVGYRFQPEVVLQVEVSPQREISLQSKSGN